jgi:glutathione S-transferase
MELIAFIQWFNNFHHEKLPGAIERYVKEVNRVTGVLEGHLAKQEVLPGGDGPWLVGNKYSFADLAFIPWQVIIQTLVPKESFNLDEFPVVKQWLKRMCEREAVAVEFPDLK